MVSTKSDSQTSMADRIRRALEETGMTEADLARRLDVSRQTVNSWLSGSEPKLEVGVRLADNLQVSAHWLSLGRGRSDPAAGMAPPVGDPSSPNVRFERAEIFGRFCSALQIGLEERDVFLSTSGLTAIAMHEWRKMSIVCATDDDYVLMTQMKLVEICAAIDADDFDLIDKVA